MFPSAHRGTGNGVAIGLNRIMGIVSAVVGQAANVGAYKFPLLFEHTVCESGTEIKIDRYSRANLYLCRALHCDGNCCWSSPIRAVWPTE